MTPQPIQFAAPASFPVRPFLTVRVNYAYRVTSKRAGSNLQPQTFTHTLGGAIEAAKGHAVELPGCLTTIEKRDGEDWKPLRAEIVAELEKQVQFYRAAYSVAAILSIQHERVTK